MLQVRSVILFWIALKLFMGLPNAVQRRKKCNKTVVRPAVRVKKGGSLYRGISNIGSER